MARGGRRISPLLTSTPIPIGDCQVVVEAKSFTSHLDKDSLDISIANNSKIRVSVMGKGNVNDCCEDKEAEKNANPKNCDEQTKSLLKDALSLYTKELPAMNYAANTGKASAFLERCVTHGKYCTLLLVSIKDQQRGEVIAAVTYQIIPVDTQYAEIPLAAVTSILQRKGIGSLLYLELKKRLWKIGIRSIFCWGDEESKAFWHKLVDAKGRARRFPIKSAVRKELCFPGGSSLMLAHLFDDGSSDYVKLPVCSPKYTSKKDFTNDELKFSEQGHEPFLDDKWNSDGCQGLEQLHIINCNNENISSEAGESTGQDKEDSCSCSVLGTKRRNWETSCTSLMSKKMKSTDSHDCDKGDRCAVSTSDRRIINHPDQSFKPINGNGHSQEALVANSGSNSRHEKNDECRALALSSKDSFREITPKTDYYRIMLMDIADGDKKSYLTNVIHDLGGVVAPDGTTCTHAVSGKVWRTLNFCTALCSGAWVVSSAWLKESYRNGRFVDETLFILKDEEYISMYRTELKDAVLRARTSPNSLLKGLDICLAAHVQPPARTLAAIVSSAGGNVITTVNETRDASKTIFIACEEDMDEAISAVKAGILTFSSDWLMNCVMRQELDLAAPQFAESL